MRKVFHGATNVVKSPLCNIGRTILISVRVSMLQISENRLSVGQREL